MIGWYKVTGPKVFVSCRQLDIYDVAINSRKSR